MFGLGGYLDTWGNFKPSVLRPAPTTFFSFRLVTPAAWCRTCWCLLIFFSQNLPLQIKQHGAERIRKQLSDTDKTREQQQEKPANQFKCDTCDFTTRSRYALKAHDLSEHKERLCDLLDANY